MTDSVCYEAAMDEMTPTLRFETATGSKYEVDEIHCMARRLEGTHEPTPRQGADGLWRPYELFSFGARALFVWGYVGGVAKATQTSDIVNSEDLSKAADLDDA